MILLSACGGEVVSGAVVVCTRHSVCNFYDLLCLSGLPKEACVQAFVCWRDSRGVYCGRRCAGDGNSDKRPITKNVSDAFGNGFLHAEAKSGNTDNRSLAVYWFRNAKRDVCRWI